MLLGTKVLIFQHFGLTLGNARKNGINSHGVLIAAPLASLISVAVGDLRQVMHLVHSEVG